VDGFLPRYSETTLELGIYHHLMVHSDCELGVRLGDLDGS